VVCKNSKPKSPKTKGCLSSGGKRWKKVITGKFTVAIWACPLEHKMNYGTKAIPLKINKKSLLLYHNGSDFMLNSLPHFFLA
tara:strand:+ start:720 stop:965 length:246 start_codon:yes stop_codon:yes gene_type:complete